MESNLWGIGAKVAQSAQALGAHPVSTPGQDGKGITGHTHRSKKEGRKEDAGNTPALNEITKDKNKDKPKPKYYNCGKQGHIAKDCYQSHGNPNQVPVAAMNSKNV
ncbi:MAG: C2HC-type zinc finger protein [Acidimicrobiales bacterium]